MDTETTPSISLYDLARVFLRLSVFAFGGPVAHIAIAEEEVVNRRQWLTREHYLDLIAAANLIPGPNSTETMIHIGYTIRGIPGAIVAGACFIVPAMLLTLLLAILYVAGSGIPQLEGALWGIKPIVVAIIANAGYRLLLTALKRDLTLWGLFAGGVVVIALLNVSEVLVMVGTGVLYVAYKRLFPMSAAALIFLIQPVTQVVEQTQASVGDLFGYFLRIGAVLFGSGYILIAYIQQDLVNTFGWLTSQQLLDAIAIGQLTPGPVLTTSTAVGYIVAGLPGAIAATVGIFLPSFVLVMLTAPLIPRMRRSQVMAAFLAGVNAGVVAAILVTLVDLLSTALQPFNGTGISPVAVVLLIGALVALIQKRLSPFALIAIGGVVGLLATLLTQAG